jgi:hypothetical protein
MIVQRVHNSKNQRDSQIKVVTRWDYTEEPSPAFKRLMSLLLQKGKERKREVADDS